MRLPKLAGGICFAVLVAAGSPVSGAPPDLRDATVIPVGRHADFLLDPTGKLTIIEVASPSRLFAPNQPERRTAGAGSALWMRLRLEAIPMTGGWSLELPGYDWPLVQVFYRNDNVPGTNASASASASASAKDDAGVTRSFEKREAGRRQPFAQALLLNQNLVFRLPDTLPKGGTIYLRFAEPPAAPIHPRLRQDAAHAHEAQRDVFLRGAYHGILLIMVISNLFLFILIRDKSSLHYSLYVLALIVFFMTDDGVLTELLWDKPLLWREKLSALSWGIFEIFFALFAKSFLKTRTQTPIADRFINISIVFSTVATIMFLLLPEGSESLETTPAGLAMATSILFLVICVMTAGFLGLRRGYVPARYFLLASSVFAVAIIVAALEALNVLPAVATRIFSMKAGVLLETVLYSFALAARFRFERRERELSQQRAMEEQRQMTATFEKFVPKQFLDRVAKEGIRSIKLGPVESDSITILFSDIRNFTSMSETMTPQQVFDFLNLYLSAMEPPIVESGGFVDKFIGDAIMALFDSGSMHDRATGAIEAALGMQRALREYNGLHTNAAFHPISTGIGIHSGPVMIGTVGSSRRMDSTAIGDTVNLASRIEGMTKTYNCAVLISEATYRELQNPARFSVRIVDRVLARGKSEPITIYEVFDEDQPEIRDKKLATRERFENAVALINSAGLQQASADALREARGLLESHLREFPEDKTAVLHLEQCASS